jgi:hypothetical protein
MLDEKITKSLPDWWRNVDPTKYYLVLGDDMDSMLSCWYLQTKFKGLEIGGFYDFKRGLYLNKEIAVGKEAIYVDCSMLDVKCFDNHKTIFVEDNPEMVNPNKGITVPYYKKYNGSVIAFLLGLYNQDMSKYSKEQLQRLLSVDSFYKGVYNKGGRYADVNYRWFERLGLLDVLKPVTDELCEQDFVDMIDDEMLYRHFEVNEDGYIQVADVECSGMRDLPTCKFELVMSVKQGRTDPQCSESKIRRLVKEKGIVSLSQIYDGRYQYSYAC